MPRSSPYGQPMGGGGSGPGNLKEGDWICPGCGNHNFASRVNCNKCQELREGMKQGDWICKSCKNHNFANRQVCNKCQAPRPADAGGPAPHGGKGAMQSGGGAYGGCGGYGPCGGGGGMMYGGGGGYGPNGKGGMMYGGGGGMMYGPCGGGKGGMMYGGGPVYGAPQPMAYGCMGSKGMVQIVPFHGMMGGAMPSASSKPMKEGDWMCPSCGNHNFASRVNCNKCNVVRAGFKDGDWICKDCKNHNFKSRTECNKCQKPKGA